MLLPVLFLALAGTILNLALTVAAEGSQILHLARVGLSAIMLLLLLVTCWEMGKEMLRRYPH